MDIAIKKFKPKGKVTAPCSKSLAHRVIIASALADKPTLINGFKPCEDTEATMEVLSRMGAEFISHRDGSMTVYPIQEMPCTGTVNCHSSGTTLRLLLPVVCALGINGYRFKGNDDLAERPLRPLLTALRRHGVVVSEDKLPLSVAGQLHGGIFKIPADVSSQFVSGLLLALPLLIAPAKIVLTTEAVSASYIKMTLEVLKQFGIVIKEEDNVFIVPRRQDYKSPGEINIEGDWSGAAPWLAAACAAGEVSIEGLKKNTCQGDADILDIINMMAGADRGDDIISVKKQKLSGVVIDGSQIPDLVPSLVVLACAAEGKTVIKNLGRLNTKESPRLTVLAENLKELGADVSVEMDEADNDYAITVKGGKRLKGGRVKSCGDHRMAMAAVALASLCNGEIILEDAEAVAKSYPDFYEDFKLLGGEYYEL